MADLIFNMSSGTVTLSHGNISFEVSGTISDSGNLDDGIAYVVGSDLTLDSITPAETTIGGNVANGAQLNPHFTGDQGYDERLAQNAPWDAALTLDLSSPVSLSSGDAVVTSIGEDPTPANVKDGVVSEYGSLVVLPSSPASGYMTNVVRPDAVTALNGQVVDITSFVAGLPNRSSTGITMPAYADLMADLDRHNPVYAQLQSLAYQEGMPNDLIPGDDNYGRDIAALLGVACIGLVVDAYTTQQKENIARRLAEWGSNFFEALNGSLNDRAYGGHYQFEHMPAALWAHLTGQSIDNYLSTTGGNWRQSFILSDADYADALTPHSDNTKPAYLRLRSIGSISGNTITVDTYRAGSGAGTQGDPGRMDMTGMRLIRNSNGASADVVSVSNTQILGGTDTYTFTVDDASPFSTSDDVYFLPPDGVILPGQVFWNPDGWGFANVLVMSAQQAYIDIQHWLGCMILLEEAGIIPETEEWRAARDWAVIGEYDNIPLPGFDWPSHSGRDNRDSIPYDGAEQVDQWFQLYGSTVFPRTTPSPSVTGTQTGATTADIDVTTDLEGGTLWIGVWPSASTPSLADIKAGTGAVFHTIKAAEETGAQATVAATGLTSGTAYKAHVAHMSRRYSNGSAESSEFTTA